MERIIFLGVFVMHYLQSITSSVALGGEIACQRGPAVPGGQVAVLSAAGRYTNGDSTISGSLGVLKAILLMNPLIIIWSSAL